MKKRSSGDDRGSGKKKKKYSKPTLTEHGLLDADAAAFSNLY